MSPKGFFEQFGGPSIERVAQHFALLEEHGWLRRVGYKNRDTKRRGPPENLYRATDAVFFDAETSASLPYSARLAWSWGVFSTISHLLRQGIEAAASDGRPSQPLTCIQLEFDEVGWMRAIEKLATSFEAIFDEHEDAKIRCASSGDALIRTGILQVGFETPRAENPLVLDLADGSSPSMSLTERMAPLLADDLSMQILHELNQTDMSVKQFHREVAFDDASEGAVRYRFDLLKNLAWIAVVDEVRKRAAYEKIYRATRPDMTLNGPWSGVSDALTETEVWQEFVHLSELVKKAMAAGTFDIRSDRHFSWSIVMLDHEGSEKVAASLERLAATLSEEEERSKTRIAAGAKPVTMAVGLTAIESPPVPYRAP
ncbi:MAG TPA: hypothetical protein VFY04_11745 [Solirubrobacterales bacterium]|nr:hypothetical protein [Solirubrobacterales bacterium]